MKAGWVFARDDGGTPSLPDGIGGRYVNPLDIVRITGGPAGNEHTHLLVGSLAMHSDQIGVFHEHFVTDVTGQWVQLTLPDSVTEHDHDLPLVDGILSPDWFLLFWAGSDADAAVIASDADCYIACQAEIVEVDGESVIGALVDEQWAAEERATWEARIENVLGLALPTEIDRGKRLVQFFVGLLLARGNQPEIALRFTS
jgi:hypothetical protein